MSIRHAIYPLAILLILSLSVVSGSRADRVLSDAAKKDAVYRMYAEYKRDFPSVRDIAPDEALAGFTQGQIVFVDTRKPEEIAVSRLPGAITTEEFLAAPQAFGDKTVVVYCTISYRSGVFARDQADRSIEVVNLRGGILGWILEGGPVFDGQGRPTRRVHVYGDRWDYAPDGWESIKFSLWQQVF